MKSTIMKKGKTAVAWAVSLAMIFATVSYPVSVAKAVDEPMVFPVVQELSEKMEGADLTGTYVLPEGHNFVYIKQASGSNVLWTLDDFSGIWGDTIDLGVTVGDKKDLVFDGSEYPELKAFFGDFWMTLNPNSDLADSEIDYIHGIENSPFVFNAGGPGEYQYEFTMDDDVITFTYDTEKVSHFYSGRYETPENPTVPVSFLKVLSGMELEADMFSFILTQTDDEWEPLSEGYTETVTNDEDGKVVFTDLEFEEAGTYYYTIKEVIPAEPIEGVVYDTHVVMLTVTVTDIGEGVLEAEAVFEGSKTFTNTYEEEELGQITVTKLVTFPEGEEPETFNKTFFITLFELDDEDMIPVATKQVVFEGDYEPGEGVDVTFYNLPLDKTYVVYETDGANDPAADTEDNIIDPAADLPQGAWINILYDNQEIELTPDNKTGEATVDNVYDPEDFNLEGSIIVVKTVTKNGELWKTSKKFYVAVFADEALTVRISDTKMINMGGAAKAEVGFTSEDIDEDYLNPDATYYIAETDSEGEAITDSLAQFGFEIEQDIDSVEAEALLAEDVTINLINKYKEEEFPVTGDSTNMNLWLFLAILGVAGAIAPFALRKREEIND